MHEERVDGHLLYFVLLLLFLPGVGHSEWLSRHNVSNGHQFSALFGENLTKLVDVFFGMPLGSQRKSAQRNTNL